MSNSQTTMLIIRGVLAALDLAIRTGRTQFRKHPEALEKYIQLRNKLRKELVEQSRQLGSSTPDDVIASVPPSDDDTTPDPAA